VAYIKLKYATISSVDDVAKYVNLSPVYFGSFFKHHIKESFTNYLNGIRIEKAKELLQDKDVKAFSISEMVGYKSIPYFYKTFKSITNLTPAQYKIKYMEGKIK
jgi:two-component system response regulator YesN